jgi:hypothetical protein
MPSPKYPYRNHMERKKGVISYGEDYEQKTQFEPNGFWYQIRNCISGRKKYNSENEKYTHMLHEEDYGSYMYEIELKQKSLTNLDKERGTNKILVLSSNRDVKIFGKKYGVDYNSSVVESYRRRIDWKKVSELYGGIEIKNYPKILRELRAESKLIYTPNLKIELNFEWLNSFNFRSGCIWNTDIIKDVSYERKLTKKEILGEKL